MRKAFSLLSIVIFLVSLAPCPDCYGDEASSEPGITSSVPTEDAHTDDVENCSPFCCACCNFTISQRVMAINLIYPTNSDYHTITLISEPVKHAGKIWQPPRA